MVSPMVRRSNSDMSCTRRLTSTALTSSGCWREKASRRCTRLAARSEACRADVSERFMPFVAVADAAQRQIDIAEDGGEQIVEIVRDAAGQPADRFHLHGLVQGEFGLLAPRHLLLQLRMRDRFAARAAQCEQPETDHRKRRRECRRSDGSDIVFSQFADHDLALDARTPHRCCSSASCDRRKCASVPSKLRCAAGEALVGLCPRCSASRCDSGESFSRRVERSG